MEKKVGIQDLIKIDDYTFEIPQSFRNDMRVPARVFANDIMLEAITEDRSLSQLVNIATLPGIQKFAFAMPDIHEGYGFPIGGVAAIKVEGGVISPGGIGYDINCGVRLLVSNMTLDELRPYIEGLATASYNAIPSGVGKGGRMKLNASEMDKVLEHGAKRLVELGYGTESDLEYCEENGDMPGADPDKISERAKQRGLDQLGTLGSGNHFLEFQVVDKIFDEEVAKVFGLRPGLVVVMIHCGSRGLGHQTCTDYVRQMVPKLEEWGLNLPDRELACAPLDSQEGKDYFAAMAAAANFAWANRHMITHNVRQAWKKILGEQVNLNLMYDISHNIGKKEFHEIDHKMVQVLMHRKGATRSFGPGNNVLPSKYMSVGQPVLIPGTMGTSSYILVGTEKSMKVAFGSTCHGAGRRLSRSAAKKKIQGKQVLENLEAKGITVRCDSYRGLAEEAPLAYKDVDNVVNVVDNAGLAKKVAQVKPIGVIKGG